MAPTFRPALAGLFLTAAALAATPALADVFSSQDFSGQTTTLEKLPGVNLDVVPGYGNGAGNCAQEDTTAFASGGGMMPQTATTCRFGNFSITSTGSGSSSALYDNTYGGNPPPWVPRWKP